MFYDNKKNDDGDKNVVNGIAILNMVNNYFNQLTISKRLVCGGASLAGLYSTKKVIDVFGAQLIRFACISAALTGGVGFSLCVVSYIMYNSDVGDEDDGEDEGDTEYEKYIDFINNGYDEFIDIYKNKSEEQYSSATDEYIQHLKDEENHKRFVLPFSYNSEMMFFYDYENKIFNYYCQSDVNSKVLNSACRLYTMNNNCIHLFQDDEEIEYMKNQAISLLDGDMSGAQPEDGVDDDTNDDDKSTEFSDGEESTGFVSIFYRKKTKAESRSTLDPEIRTNKFFYKGTMDDYNNIYKVSKPIQKNMSYQEYIEGLRGAAK